MVRPTTADQNTLQHEELFVWYEVADELVGGEYLDVDPDERRQQEQMKEQHERGAASRVAELPPRRDYEEHVQKDDEHTAVDPDQNELVQLHTSERFHSVKCHE